MITTIIKLTVKLMYLHSIALLVAIRTALSHAASLSSIVRVQYI